LEQFLLANALGQRREVAHVLAVTLAYPDVGDLDFFQHGMVCDHVIRLQFGSPRCIALIAFAASNASGLKGQAKTFPGRWS